MNSRRIFILVLATLPIGAVVAMGLAGGRGPDPDGIPTGAEVQGRLMSPFCPGLTVAECPSGQAAELRHRIDALVASGATNREIDAWAVANYGEAALGRPRDPLAWLAPAVAVLMGLGLVLAKLARREPVEARGAGAEPAAPISPDQQDRLLRELGSFERDAPG